MANLYKVKVLGYELYCTHCQKNEWYTNEIHLDIRAIFPEKIEPSRQIFECSYCGDIRLFKSFDRYDQQTGRKECNIKLTVIPS